jgi:hypothetical protein
MNRKTPPKFAKVIYKNIIFINRILLLITEMFLKQEIKYYIINTEVTNNLSLKKVIPCIQYELL